MIFISVFPNVRNEAGVCAGIRYSFLVSANDKCLNGPILSIRCKHEPKWLQLFYAEYQPIGWVANHMEALLVNTILADRQPFTHPHSARIER